MKYEILHRRSIYIYIFFLFSVELKYIQILLNYYTAVILQKFKMLWKLVKIIITYIAIIDISLASYYFTHNDSYECKLGQTTPYRCVANFDESSLKYSGTL